MRYHKAYLFLLALLTTAGARADASGEIPFRLVQGFAIVVRGRVGPVNDLNFLLDTGAVPSVIGARLASRMGVEGERGSFHLLSKEIDARYVTVDDVCLGTICSASLSMVVVDLQQFERLLGVRIDAVIGLDLLAGENISIDYRAKKIVRGLSGRSEYSVSVEIASAAGAPYWLLPIQISGQSLRVLLDTGTNEFGVFSRTGSETYVDLKKNASEVVLPQLFMGNRGFEHKTEAVLKLPPGTMQGVDGVLGPKALGICRIELDWGRRRLLWSEK